MATKGKSKKLPHPKAVKMALHVLIKFYTFNRDWFMVQRLLADLSRVDEHIKLTKERDNATQPE